MNKKPIIFFIAAVCAAPALAADSGLYGMANLGLAHYKNVDPFPDPGMGGIGAGYRLNRFLAAEAGGTIYGKSVVGPAEIQARSFTAAAVVHLPVAKDWSVFGKIGASRNHAEGNNRFGSTFKSTQTSGYWGLGAEFACNAWFSMRAQYENFGRFESASQPMKASAVSGAVVFYLP